MSNMVLLLKNLTWPGWAQPYFVAADSLIEEAMLYLDIDYLRWLYWLFFPLIISFLFPTVLLLFIYGNAVFLHIYRLRHRIREAYGRGGVWDGAKSALASFWDAQGWIWHGYEVEGLENIPDSGAAMIIYYHGTVPVDVYYLMAKMILYKNRSLHCVADKFLWRIPGWHIVMETFGATPGNRENLVEQLGNNHVICISPGGMREALFSNDYQLMWAKRRGFVRVALEANVPVIPMFTENCREAFRTPALGQRFWRWVYEKTRMPLVPIFGYFPVKMRTYLGNPITHHCSATDVSLPKELSFELNENLKSVPENINCSPISPAKTHGKTGDTQETKNTKGTTTTKDLNLESEPKNLPDIELVTRGCDRSPNELQNGRGDWHGRLHSQEECHGLFNEREKIFGEEELRKRIAKEIENLIAEHQRKPGNIGLALLDRIPRFRVWYKKRAKNKGIIRRQKLFILVLISVILYGWRLSLRGPKSGTSGSYSKKNVKHCKSN